MQEIFRKSVRHQKELFLPLLKMRVEAKRMQSISRQKVCRPSPNLQNSPCSPISEQIWLDLVCLRAFWPFVKGNWVRLPYSPWELNSRTSQEASVTKLFYQGNGIVLAKLWMCKFVLTSNLKNEIENALWFVWFFLILLQEHAENSFHCVISISFYFSLVWNFHYFCIILWHINHDSVK